MFTAIATLCGTLALAAGPSTQIRGDYVEARNADVYTGPCFSNAEVFITGNRAVMAWKVTEGTYQGQDLQGLSVAAAVRGHHDLLEGRRGRSPLGPDRRQGRHPARSARP